MTLKEQIHADVGNLFFSESEMAEWHTLNDVRVLAIVDIEKLEKWKAVNLPAGISLPGMALADAEVFLFLPATALAEPLIGEVIWYDGRPLRVQSVAVIDGMMELVLGGNV